MKMIKMKASSQLISLRLEDMSGALQPRTFVLTSQRVTMVPINYAKSIYNYSGAAKLYKNGKIIIVEGEEALIEVAEEDYLEIPNKVDTTSIVNILLGNDVSAIKKLFSGENKELALELAQENINEMSMAIVHTIEDITKLSLTEA